MHIAGQIIGSPGVTDRRQSSARGPKIRASAPREPAVLSGHATSLHLTPPASSACNTPLARCPGPAADLPVRDGTKRAGPGPGGGGSELPAATWPVAARGGTG
jgi:hypothetical protein